MSYLVLARKYRPRIFADMVGQESISKTLRGAIAENRVGHAYLFSGPRGTGKTTTARIFAKALNCERGPTPDPCGECERCRAADDGSEIDIIEIDAASNTGVDDVRLLRDQVAYAPMRARFKVYIIDEVHMLSRGAFNAFLKTLEEPPPHVKFLFATTDPQEVPETILSRCQVLKLAPIAEKTIAARLAHVFEAEKVEPENGVCDELARRARGGMRDALSLADQLLSLVGTRPTLADVARLGEGGGVEEIERVVAHIVAGDRAEMLLALPRTGGGEGEFLSGLLEYVRASLVVLVLGENNPVVAETPERARAMKAWAEKLGLARMQNWLEELIVARERIRVLPTHGRAVLEATLLDLAREETTVPLDELAARLIALEARLAESGGTRAPQRETTTRAAALQPAGSESTAPSRAAPSHSVVRPAAAGQAVTNQGTLHSGATHPAASNSSAPNHDAPSQRAVAPSAASRSESKDMSANERSAGEGAAARSGRAGSASTEPGVLQPAARRTAPVSETPRAEPAATSGTRKLVSGTSDTWARFLESLSGTSASLADALRLRGKLADLAHGRALVQLANLREGERALVFEPRNQRAASQALSHVVGSPVQVVFEDQTAVRGQKDEYTSKIAELFDGRIEDEG